MNNADWFEDLSLTHLRQEATVIKNILAQRKYAESDSDIETNLFESRGKAFDGFSNEQLSERVAKILIKFKKVSIITSFDSDKKGEELFFHIDLNGKINLIQNYQEQLNQEIEEKQIDEGLIKHNRWFKLDEKNMSATLELQDGSIKQISFTHKKGNNRMFFVFKILYDKFISNPKDPFISKSEIVQELKKENVELTERDVKDTIGNIRTNKLNGVLENYIKIDFDKQKNKYGLSVTRT